MAVGRVRRKAKEEVRIELAINFLLLVPPLVKQEQEQKQVS
jgi:hypothetical protein